MVGITLRVMQKATKPPTGTSSSFRRKSLERALCNYVEHYHLERNHQGLGNQLIEPNDHVGSTAGNIQCRERLGGLLRYYYRDAA
jgi:hypothetical protein